MREPGPVSGRRVAVVGAGVVGLSCAVRLAEAGPAVRVVAREAPLATTSAVAAAMWFPYLAEPRERVMAWAAATRLELERLARDEPASGVVVRELVVVASTAVTAASPAPWWADGAAGWRAAAAEELPPGRPGAYLTPVPVAESPRYLPWLAARLAAAGATLELRPQGLASLDEAAAGADVVVDCSGLGARELAGDASVVPVRGQVVLVAAPGVARAYVDDEDPAGPAYVIPRRDDCVVGGTADAGAWDTTPDSATTAAILGRATALVPALAGAPVLAVRCGLRPVRPEVRLERGLTAAGVPVVHCYGHGGSGLTLSWGCAGEVAALVAR